MGAGVGVTEDWAGAMGQQGYGEWEWWHGRELQQESNGEQPHQQTHHIPPNKQ